MTGKAENLGFVELFRSSWENASDRTLKFFKSDIKLNSLPVPRFLARCNDTIASKAKGSTLMYTSISDDANVGLAVRQSSVFVLLEMNNTDMGYMQQPIAVSEITMSCKVSAVSLLNVGRSVFVAAGDEKGNVTVFELDLGGITQHRVVASYATNQAVRFIAHQPIDLLHRGNQNILYLWIVFNDSLRLIGCKLPNLDRTTSTAAPAVKKMQQYFHFNSPANHNIYGTFQKAEVLDTENGRSSLLACHYLKTAAGGNSTVSVFTIDSRLILKFAEKIRRGEIPPPDKSLPTGPVVTVPFVSAAGRYKKLKKKSTGLIASTSTTSLLGGFFGFGSNNSRSMEECEDSGDDETGDENNDGVYDDGKEEVVLCSMVQRGTVQPPAVVDYSSLESGIARSVFAFTVSILGSKGTVVTTDVQTAQSTLAAQVAQLGGKAFSHPDTAVDCRATVDYALIDTNHRVSTESARDKNQSGLNPVFVRLHPKSTDPEAEFKLCGIDSQLQRRLESVPLWRAALELELVSPDRLAALKALTSAHDGKFSDERTAQGSKYDSAAETQAERQLGRLVLMEWALVSGHAGALAAYITAHKAHPNGYDVQFELTDVKRVHEWAVRTTLQYGRLACVQSHIDAMSRDLVVNHIVPLLLSRESRHEGAVSQRSEVSRDLPLALSIELQSRITVCSGLKTVVEALLERKLYSYDDKASVDGGGSGEWMSVTSGGDVMGGVIEEATTELRVRLLEVDALLGVLRTMLVVCMHPEVSLNCLLPYSDAADSESLYNASKTARLVIPASLKYIPSSLHGGLLFDELRRLLDDNLLALTNIPNTNDSIGLAQAVTELFFLPMATLRSSTAVVMSNIADGVNTVDIDLTLNSAIQIGNSIVLHFLLDALFWSTSTADHEELDTVSFGVELGCAMNMSEPLNRGVVALFQIDASARVADAVRDICEGTANIAADESMLLAAVKRMVSSHKLEDARQLLQHLQVVDHPLMRSQIGVLGHAACLNNTVWQSVWQNSRKLCDGIADVDEAVDTRQKIVHIVGGWAMRNGELIAFLSSAVDSVELEAVLSFLRDLAYREIDACAVDAPCVDLFVSYLLKQDMYREALQVHDDHEAAVRTQPLEAINAASFALITRKTMLNAHNSLPRVTGLSTRDIKGIVHPELIYKHREIAPAPVVSSPIMRKTVELKEDVLLSALREAGMLHLLNSEGTVSDSAVKSVRSDFKLATASKPPYFNVSAAVDMEVEEQEKRCGLGQGGVGDLAQRMKLSRQQQQTPQRQNCHHAKLHL